MRAVEFRSSAGTFLCCMTGVFAEIGEPVESADGLLVVEVVNVAFVQLG